MSTKLKGILYYIFFLMIFVACSPSGAGWTKLSGNKFDFIEYDSKSEMILAMNEFESNLTEISTEGESQVERIVELPHNFMLQRICVSSEVVVVKGSNGSQFVLFQFENGRLREIPFAYDESNVFCKSQGENILMFNDTAVGIFSTKEFTPLAPDLGRIQDVALDSNGKIWLQVEGGRIYQHGSSGEWIFRGSYNSFQLFPGAFGQIWFSDYSQSKPRLFDIMIDQPEALSIVLEVPSKTTFYKVYQLDDKLIVITSKGIWIRNDAVSTFAPLELPRGVDVLWFGTLDVGARKLYIATSKGIYSKVLE